MNFTSFKSAEILIGTVLNPYIYLRGVLLNLPLIEPSIIFTNILQAHDFSSIIISFSSLISISYIVMLLQEIFKFCFLIGHLSLKGKHLPFVY